MNEPSMVDAEAGHGYDKLVIFMFPPFVESKRGFRNQQTVYSREHLSVHLNIYEWKRASLCGVLLVCIEIFELCRTLNCISSATFRFCDVWGTSYCQLLITQMHQETYQLMKSISLFADGK